jgi:methionyl-tRNA formyltransferase
VATELGLPLTPTENINTEPLPAADLMIVIAFGQKIAEAVVNHPRLGSVNLHSSLLPKYRGAAPINWAVINGDLVTGNSIIRLANKMDAGAVLAQNTLTIDEFEIAGELHDRLANLGVPLMLECVERLQAGTAIETEQDHSLASIAPKLSRQMAMIDWTQPAAAVVRFINGLSPWPGCQVSLFDGEKEVAKLTLLRAALGNKSGTGVFVHPQAGSEVLRRAGSDTENPALRSTSEPARGVIRPDGTIAAGDGNSVAVVELQPEGKRPMKLQDFRNGRPWREGMRVSSSK